MFKTIDKLASSEYVRPNAITRAVSRPIDRFVRRLMDITVSALGIILTAPVFAVIAILVKNDTPGPVYYRGRRMGLRGREFNILKFRTMFEEPASDEGPRVTAQDDPRVTPLGRWLRNTKLNELPQFWNVLKGDMSLVGPRPEDPEIVQKWPEDVREEVLSVRPGITSPASVLYRNEETLLQNGQVMHTYLEKILPSKLRLDQLYVRNRSVWLDLDILFWTFLVLLPKLDTYAPPEELLFLGPVSRVMRRYVSWFAIDLLVTFIAFGITGGLWRSFAVLDVGWTRAVLAALGFSLIFSLTGAILGANRITWSKASSSDVWDLVLPAVIASGLSLLLNWWIGTQPDILYPGTTGFLPPAMVMIASALALFGFVVVRFRARLLSGLAYRWLRGRGGAWMAREKVLIIGGGAAGQFMAWFLNNGDQINAFHVVGIVDDDLYKQGTRMQGVPVLGRREDIPRLVEKQDIGILVFAIHNIKSADRQALLEICANTSAQVVMMPDLLAMMNAVSQGSPSNGNGEVDDQMEGSLSQSTEFTGLKIQPDQLRESLEEIDAFLAEGDLAAARDRLCALEKQLQIPVRQNQSPVEAMTSASEGK